VLATGARSITIQDEEIRQKIASFPRWHYRFDLKGNLTPIFEERFANRHEQRKKYFFDPLVQLFGGSLAGKRVLDLGCNAGFWSLSPLAPDVITSWGSTVGRCT